MAINNWYFTSGGSSGWQFESYPCPRMSAAHPGNNTFSPDPDAARLHCLAHLGLSKPHGANALAPLVPLVDEFKDIAGISGQGGTDPPSLFENHQFVRISSGASHVYYDPSYGVQYESIEAFVQSAVRALVIVRNAPVGMQSETQLMDFPAADNDHIDTACWIELSATEEVTSADFQLEWIDYP